MRHVRTLPVAALAVAAVAALAACGSSSSTTTSTSSTAATSSSAAAPSSSAAAAGSATGAAAASATSAAAVSGPATIDLATTKLGAVLTAGGRTLYMYVPDTPGTSTCYGKCAVAWPPVLTKGAPVAGPGITASLLGTTTRTDGTVQVTYNKYPLYLFIKDKAAGDVTGQGVQQIWYVLNAKGAVVKTAP